MFKKLMKTLFGGQPEASAERENTNKQISSPTSDISYKEESVALFNQAYDQFEQGNIKKATQLIEESNDFLIRSFAKTDHDIESAKRFFGVDENRYKAAKEISLPIKGILQDDLNQIQRKVCWYALNGIKPNYVLISFLMFRDYVWEEFDQELQRANESNNPESYGIYYFIKNNPKEWLDMEHYRIKFYALSLDARTLLTSYNCVGGKRELKVEDIQNFNNQRGAQELFDHGYVTKKDDGLTIEFPVEHKKQVMYEKKKLESLMQHLMGLAYRKREYREGKKRAKEDNAETAYFLVNGSGGSIQCKREAILVSRSKEGQLPPHSIGCTCNINFVRKKELLHEKVRAEYGLI